MIHTLLTRFRQTPLLTFEVLTASLFICLLNLALPIFVIQLLNRYVSHGFEGTLYTLTSGVLMATLLQYGFRAIRTALLARMNRRAGQGAAPGGPAEYRRGPLRRGCRAAPGTARRGHDRYPEGPGRLGTGQHHPPDRDFKVPVHVEIADRIPRNPGGKVLKKELRKEWESRSREGAR